MCLAKATSLLKIAVVSIILTGCMSTTDNEATLSKNEQIRKADLEDAYQELLEWKHLQPSIVRLIALEQDLKFILDEVGNTKQGVEHFPVAKVLSTGFDGFTEQAVNNNAQPSSNQQVSNDKFMGASFPLVNNIELDAQAVTKPLSLDYTSVETIDNKFSGSQSRDRASLQPPQQQVESLRAGELNTNYSQCFERKGEFALHLVSYSQQNQINEGWNKIKNVINPITCNREPLVDEVIVKNKKYYSLRVGPYLSSQQAKEICSIVSIAGLYCGVTKYSGKSI